ncbi:putative leucine-rich repeat receptor-like serine/threonine-protein kinase At2g19230 [Mangifera indica]|uniref:putative leucine-rich repeat receptor-like serine/threonine-protein kinase At2g19230 n=1 Tax=Mangifera indica TaxID=29780 RepID=UPI001CFAA3DC|nr:putative leucine-rich repeat receptor-like serine/threonine-protein kinase At2g19230 [Mangifera indica]
MEMFKHFSLVLVHGCSYNAAGFISIDCGISENSGYTDKLTGLNYTSDAIFIETGVSKNISPEYTNITLEQQFLNVRSFPEGVKNCYTLKPLQGNLKIFIRATFMYGDYDGQGQVPSFDLLLEADVWDSKNYAYVCLVNTGSGTPFISALELRPVTNSTYQTESGSLLLSWRWDVGSTHNGTSKDLSNNCLTGPVPEFLSQLLVLTVLNLSGNKLGGSIPANLMGRKQNGLLSLRYIDDPFDRIWTSYNSNSWVVIISSQPIDSSDNRYRPPSTVMRTAVPKIHRNGKIDFSIIKTDNSSRPPIPNAFEVYTVKEFSQFSTNQQDVDAVMNIKLTYGLKSIWQGDPCGPKNYMWQGINCSYEDSNPPRIISLNLSSSGISGEISPHISGLTSIKSLDLSNNNLIGPMPEFLSYRKLSGNKLKGSIPAALMDKKQNGFLSLNVEGNPDLCLEASCKGRDKTKLTVPVVVVPIVAVVVSIFVILTAMTILWNFKTRKQVGKKNESLESKTPRYKYSDLVRFTNNFEKAIGKGGFGAVYRGCMDDTQVAVKMLSPSSVQGYKEFKAEIELLMRVHHKNLTTLISLNSEIK